jgi:hypothetical protein
MCLQFAQARRIAVSSCLDFSVSCRRVQEAEAAQTEAFSLAPAQFVAASSLRIGVPDLVLVLRGEGVRIDLWGGLSIRCMLKAQ